ncbi:hypothetical protein CQB05_02890 [Paracidovorax citrulli]|nr:hypothetical protein CQB05_02890 [Paracidovorax citrulli]
MNMQISEAKMAGVEAFRAGKGRAPALNPGFVTRAIEAGNLLNLMDAYLHGWTIASLAHDAPLPTMPSVVELAQIEAAAA